MAFIENIKSFFGFNGRKNFDISDLSLRNTVGPWRSRGFVGFTDSTAHQAYAAHELVYACVQKTADVMNDAEIQVERRSAGGDEWEPVPDHPLVALIKKPNPFETGRQFRRLMVQSELTAGLLYAELVRSGAKRPVEIYALNPQRVTPVVSRASGELQYYEYIRGDGFTRRIEPEDMLVRRRSDLASRFYGLSPVAVALKSINSDLGLTDYIDAFFENDGTPSGILTVLNVALSATKKEAIAADWRRKYARGGASQKDVAVLDQDMQFQSIGSRINELEADSLTGRFESRICSVFGVPPILVGAQVGLKHTTANATAKAALQDFWDNKISPELAELREWLTWFVLPEFEDERLIRSGRIRVGYDISQAKFLQEDVDQIHARARANYQAGGWTRNEFREATGLEPVESGDQFRDELMQETRPALAAAVREAEEIELERSALDAKPEQKQIEKRIEKQSAGEIQEYRRELSAAEKAIDLQGMRVDLESTAAELKTVIGRMRSDLIEQAARKAEDLDDRTSPDFQLEIPIQRRRELERLLEKSYLVGQLQVSRELLGQGKAKKNLGDFSISTLVNLIIARITSEIKQRAVNVAAALFASDAFTSEKMRSDLESESEKVFDQAGRNFANAAIQAGRRDALKDLEDETGLYEYSAILDRNVCSPCRRWDGEQASRLEDLPRTPNPDCEGGANCRCFVIGIRD